jgi:hypothetical protein
MSARRGGLALATAKIALGAWGNAHAPAKEDFAQPHKNKSQIDWRAARGWGPPGARDGLNLSSSELSH